MTADTETDAGSPQPRAAPACNLCVAGGLLPTTYNPRERRCAFPNNGDHIGDCGWGCVTEDMLCEVLRRDDSVRISRFYLGQDANASLLELTQDEEPELPSAVWASWYKSRGHFDHIVGLYWSSEFPPRPLNYRQAVEIIRRSRVRTHYHDLLEFADVPKGERGQGPASAQGAEGEARSTGKPQ